MKNILLILIAVFVFASCKDKKKRSDVLPTPIDTTKVVGSDTIEVCTLGMEAVEFEINKSISEVNMAARGKKPKPDPVPPINPDNPSNWPVILLDFDGHLLSGTMWNWQGDIYCEPSGLDSNGVAVVTGRVIEYLKQFKVIITTSESTYTTATSKKQRVILTTTYEPFGVSGGTSMLNSFTNNTNTPCLVFTSLLVQLKKISDASAHEIGHTLGLYHQSTCVNGVKTSEYRSGFEIMGYCYSHPTPGWTESGMNALCRNVNEFRIINRTLESI